MCYAFMMSPDTDSGVKWDFDNGYSGNYSRADGGAGGLTGSTNAPVLVKELNFANKPDDRHTLLLTGLDMPYVNKGERLNLYYNEGIAMNNAQNYAVLYRLDISNFTGTKAVFEYSPYTTPEYLNGGGAVYVSCVVKQNGIQYYNNAAPLVHPAVNEPGSSTIFEVDFTSEEFRNFDPEAAFEFYTVVSGMSSMPVKVRLE